MRKVTPMIIVDDEPPNYIWCYSFFMLMKFYEHIEKN